MNAVGSKVFSHFGLDSQGQTTALQNLRASRAGIAASLSSTQAVLGAVTAAFGRAQQGNVAGSGNLAARAAIARVRAEALARKDTILKQLDSAQATLDSAKAASQPTGTTIVGYSVIQKYVSWAAVPTTTTDTTTDTTA